MSHLNQEAIRKLVKKSLIPNASDIKDISKCDSCLVQKSHNFHYKQTTVKSTQV